MNIKKVLVLMADLASGAIVISVGLSMLPFPYDLVWGAFNAYVWIAAPTLLWFANKKVSK